MVLGGAFADGVGGAFAGGVRGPLLVTLGALGINLHPFLVLQESFSTVESLDVSDGNVYTDHKQFIDGFTNYKYGGSTDFFFPPQVPLLLTLGRRM